MHRWQRGQMHGIANPESRGFESLPMFQDLGRKVFMDAHSTVTAEEGDRYPLGPPSICARLILRVGFEAKRRQV